MSKLSMIAAEMVGVRGRIPLFLMAGIFLESPAPDPRFDSTSAVRASWREELLDEATDLARSVPAEIEESAKPTPALAPSHLAFGYFLDRIQLRRDTS